MGAHVSRGDLANGRPEGASAEARALGTVRRAYPAYGGLEGASATLAPWGQYGERGDTRPTAGWRA